MHMQSPHDQTVVVAGATGNIGPFVVRALLERGARVAVPSRSKEKLREMQEHLGQHLDETKLRRLHTFVGDLGDEREAAVVRQRISDQAGTPDAVVASLGDFVTTPTLLGTRTDELQRAIDSYLLANFVVARTFLPVLKNSGGTYLMVQGPLAFELYPEINAHLISIATAAQHMLFRALTQELMETRAHVVELVCHVFIRDRQTQPSSPISGEALGDYTARVLFSADEAMHGRSIHLRYPEQVTNVGFDEAVGRERLVPSISATASARSQERR
jgi:NAD(P)-dependent dehydrogenase (short-subunit alcohol dehydrogenase family)